MAAVEGGATSSGLPRDAAGREIVSRENDDHVPRSAPRSNAAVVGGSVWDQAPTARVRHRSKRPARVDHRVVLGEEPRLCPDDIRAGQESDVDEVQELLPDQRARRPATKPRAEEVRRHVLTHVPYQPWCGVCVAGRGLAQPHRRTEPVVAEDSGIRRVAWDWAFFRDAEGGHN